MEQLEDIRKSPGGQGGEAPKSRVNEEPAKVPEERGAFGESLGGHALRKLHWLSRECVSVAPTWTEQQVWQSHFSSLDSLHGCPSQSGCSGWRESLA